MSDKSVRKKGSFCIAVGIIMLLVVFAVSIYNKLEAERAETDSQKLISELIQYIPQESDDIFSEFTEREMPAITLENVVNNSENIESENDTISTNQERYVGIIKIPDLDVEIPVAENASYEALRYGACRYSGSAYKDDLVIAAHNYSTHFGRISQLSAGSEIDFYDFEGTEHRYKVLWQEIVQPTDIEYMISDPDNEWDLTLYTCTWGGQSRVTVRCTRI